MILSECLLQGSSKWGLVTPMVPIFSTENLEYIFTFLLQQLLYIGPWHKIFSDGDPSARQFDMNKFEKHWNTVCELKPLFYHVK